MGPKSLQRFQKSYRTVEELKKRTIDRPHWLLMFLGVEPSKQGVGIGRSLIQPMLDRADAENLPCYLESANEQNLRFYQRCGFQIAGETRMPDEGPTMWAMLRDPAHPPEIA